MFIKIKKLSELFTRLNAVAQTVILVEPLET